MADLTIPHLLAHNPEPTPPWRWRILFIPAFLAIVGILLATFCAKAGQDAMRQRDTEKLQKDLFYWQHEVSEAIRFHQPQSVIDEDQRIVDEKLTLLQKDRDRDGYRSYARPGRHFTQWDGYRYEEIMTDGYFYPVPGDPEKYFTENTFQRPGWPEPRAKNVVWYPLYPVLGWIVMKVLHVAPHVALTIVSQACIVVGAVVFFLFARRHFYNRMPKLFADGTSPTSAELHPSRRWELAPQDSAALWALAALLFAPCSIFLYANFTESLFVLLLVSFLYCLQGRQWWAAAVIAAFASATRSQGVLFGPVLGLAFLLRSDVRNVFVRILIAGVLGLISEIGLISYMIYLQRVFQDPMAFMHAQVAWNVGISQATIYHALNPVNAMAHLVEVAQRTPTDWPRLWEAFCVIWPPIALLVLGGRFLSFELEMVGWMLWGLPYVASSRAGMIPETEAWMSMGRFMAVLIPANIIAGAVILRFRWIGIPLLAFGAAVFGLFAYKYGNGEWIG